MRVPDVPLSEDPRGFGSCCSDLKQLLENEEFEPLIYLNDSAQLCLAVGYSTTDEGEVSWYEHALLYCPFCGTQLQTREELQAAAAKRS